MVTDSPTLAIAGTAVTASTLGRNTPRLSLPEDFRDGLGRAETGLGIAVFRGAGLRQTGIGTTFGFGEKVGLGLTEARGIGFVGSGAGFGFIRRN